MLILSKGAVTNLAAAFARRGRASRTTDCQSLRPGQIIDFDMPPYVLSGEMQSRAVIIDIQAIVFRVCSTVFPQSQICLSASRLLIP
jgi:hypothetical protein